MISKYALRRPASSGAIVGMLLCYSRPTITLLFDCNALGEVSGLVYVAAAADCYVVGEELEGDYFEDGEE